LTNQSQDPANDYFADGLTSEIIRNLANLDGLAVRSQTSSFVLKGKPRNVREAGTLLGVDYLLELSILRAGQRLRINAQLVRVRDDIPLWSERYDRDLADIFAVQDEISRGIVNSLRLKLGRGRRRYETSIEAYDLYLRARAMVIQSGFPAINKSTGPFKEVIAKDPSFAPAYAGLAVAHVYRSTQFYFDIADEISNMRVAAQKAIQLDPLSAEAHDALGMVYSRDAQWEQSEKSFRRAIELNPNRSTSYANFAVYLLLVLGRNEEALQQLRVAEKVDPLSPEVQYGMNIAFLLAGRNDEADVYCEKLPPDYWAKKKCQLDSRLRLGRNDEVIQILEADLKKSMPIAWGTQTLGCAYARAGRREDAEKVAAGDSQSPFSQATIFACLGDKDRAFEALDRGAATGPVWTGMVLNSPRMELLRGDPRKKALRKKAGLPE
jgi:TolB-like protein